MACCLAVSFACSIDRRVPRAPVGVPSDIERRELTAELERYYGDFSARDWTRFADHFWSGATLTTIWQPPGAPASRVDVQTVPEFVAKAPEGPGSKPIFEERMTAVEIRVHHNLAQVWATYSARFGDSAQVMSWRGIDAITLMKHEGRWRITSLSFTDLDGEVTNRDRRRQGGRAARRQVGSVTGRRSSPRM